MKALFASLALVLGAVTISAADEKDLTAGKWVVESVTRDGKAVEALKGAIRENGDGKYTLTPAKDSKAPAASGTYKIDATKTPATMDTVAKGGTYDGKTLLGIVKADGDTLTLAFAEPGKDRPTKFESAEGSGIVLVVHKKAK